MNLVNYYLSSTKISYKDYNIDDKINICIIEDLQKLTVTFKKRGLPFVVTGSLSLFIHHNIVYRTFKDIDLIIKNKNNLEMYVRCLTEEGYTVCAYQGYSLKETLKYYLDGRHNIFYFYSHQKFYYLDLIYNPCIDRKCYTKGFENFSLEYTNPMILKNVWDREVDKSDHKIYSDKY
jgi:hypothetical protein